MNYLVVDIGNTNIVMAVFDGKKIKKKWRISSFLNRTKDEYILWLKYIADQNFSFKDIIIGSVVPDITQELKVALKSFFKITPYVIAEDIKVNFPTELEVPSEIGTDRIVNALCAWRLYKKPAVIIDFGTATTFDVVIRDVYWGGIIAPGVNLSLKNLISKAELIPKINLNKTNIVIGKNTKQAVVSGFYWGYSGLIEKIIFKISKITKKNFKIILTGGLAHLFKTNISFKVLVDKNLTIKGLIKAHKILNK